MLSFGHLELGLDSQPQQHRDVLEQQHQQLEQLLQTVVRQKEMGRAIGDELDVQNAMLRELDQKVEIADVRMRGANQKVKTLK